MATKDAVEARQDVRLAGDPRRRILGAPLVTPVAVALPYRYVGG
jgi:hypothetical protein